MKCGNMIDEKHNMLKCVLGGKYSKIPWGFITILLFSYILHPFEIGIVIIFLVEMSEIANDPEKKL